MDKEGYIKDIFLKELSTEIKDIDEEFVYEGNVYITNFEWRHNEEEKTVDLCLIKVPDWIAHSYLEKSEKFTQGRNPFNITQFLRRKDISEEEKSRAMDAVDNLGAELRQTPKEWTYYRFKYEDYEAFNKTYSQKKAVIPASLMKDAELLEDQFTKQ